MYVLTLVTPQANKPFLVSFTQNSNCSFIDLKVRCVGIDVDSKREASSRVRGEHTGRHSNFHPGIDTLEFYCGAQHSQLGRVNGNPSFSHVTHSSSFAAVTHRRLQLALAVFCCVL